MDQEKNLKHKWVQAELEYVKFMTDKYHKQFADKLQERGLRNLRFSQPPPDSADDFIIADTNIECSDEVKKLYKKLALRYHPDKNPSPEAEEIFVKIQYFYQKNDLSGLQEIDKFGCVDNTKELEEELNSIKSKVLWVWISSDEMVRRIIEDAYFISDDEKNSVQEETPHPPPPKVAQTELDIKQKLQSEIEKLKCAMSATET